MIFFQASISNKDKTLEPKDKIVIFPDGYKIEVWEPTSNSCKTIFKITEKNYIIDFDSVKIINDRLLVMLKNESGATFNFKPGTVYEIGQKGNIYQKYYSIDLQGNKTLIKTVTIKAIDDDYLEVTEINQQQSVLSRKIQNIRKVNVYNEKETVKVTGINGVQLIIEHKSLFIEKLDGIKNCLLEVSDKCNPKVAYGCYDLFINQRGTKGLCSYYPIQTNNRSQEKECIVEVNISSGQIIKYTDIYGRNPTLSSDEKFILLSYLYRSNYYVYDIHSKIKKELPKCKYAIWYTGL
jgi:hypothetical protein